MKIAICGSWHRFFEGNRKELFFNIGIGVSFLFDFEACFQDASFNEFVCLFSGRTFVVCKAKIRL